MDLPIITIFVLCDEYLQASKHTEDSQCKVSDAEVMTTAVASTLFFQGNFEKSSALLKMSGAIPTRLSRSQFNRRVHRLKPSKPITTKPHMSLIPFPFLCVTTFAFGDPSAIKMKAIEVIRTVNDAISMA